MQEVAPVPRRGCVAAMYIRVRASPHRVGQHGVHDAAHHRQAVLPEAKAEQQRPAPATKLSHHRSVHL